MRRFLCLFFLLYIFLPAQAVLGIPYRVVDKEDNLNSVLSGDNTRYIIRSQLDLNGSTVRIGKNSTLDFRGGSFSNGVIEGQGTQIRYASPFIGEALTIIDCSITRKKSVKDNEVFISVKHQQREIQTLFDISAGIPIEFSKGTYNDIDKITVNTNINANFNDGTINLKEDLVNPGTCPCFYTEPWKDNGLEFFNIHNLKIVGTGGHLHNNSVSRRCIQLFHIDDVELDNIYFDKYNIGKEEYVSGDLADKSSYRTSFVSIIKYDKCVIRNCTAKEIKGEMFWCAPNDNPKNLTYFIDNTYLSGGWSFFTIIDGRCVVTGNEVHGYEGSAFNVFCYNSEIAYNKFYDGKRSCAIDLSEGTMYRSRNVFVHHNECINTKALLWGYGEDIRVENNHWESSNTGDGQIIVVVINSRNEKEEGKEYVGGINNPMQEGESKNVQIKNNKLIVSSIKAEQDVRAIQVNGDNMSVVNNQLSGFHAPVVEMINGSNFKFRSNELKKTQATRYQELLLNEVIDVSIRNNSFSLLFDNNNTYSVIGVKQMQGELDYRGNVIDNIGIKMNSTIEYFPVLIQEKSNLKKVKVKVQLLDGSKKWKDVSRMLTN